MVPSSYSAYFEAASAAAGALIGLLFVVVSLHPEGIVGPKAPPSAKGLAGSSFTALVNAFFVALLGLVPGQSLGVGACVMAVISLFNTLRLHFRRMARAHRSTLVASVGAYGVQLGYGISLTLHPHDSGDVAGLTFVLISAFAVALVRAWTLMEAQGTPAAEETAVTSAPTEARDPLPADSPAAGGGGTPEPAGAEAS